MSNEKFRPYLNSQELLTIISALKQLSPLPLGLVRYLETFAIKIERGVISPAHTLQPTIEQKLGIVDSEPTTSSIAALATNYEMFPADRHKFTPRQLEAIQNYRFLNDRMTPDEENIYVSSLLKE